MIQGSVKEDLTYISTIFLFLYIIHIQIKNLLNMFQKPAPKKRMIPSITQIYTEEARVGNIERPTLNEKSSSENFTATHKFCLKQ